MSGGIPVTTKADKENHGIGIGSVRYAAARYGGEVKLEAGDALFTVKVLLPCLRDGEEI